MEANQHLSPTSSERCGNGADHPNAIVDNTAIPAASLNQQQQQTPNVSQPFTLHQEKRNDREDGENNQTPRSPAAAVAGISANKAVAASSSPFLFDPNYLELIRETMAYVLDQGSDADVWMSNSRRLRSKTLHSRTFMLRMFIILLGNVSGIVDLAAVAVSFTADLDLKTIFRAVALIAALLLTAITTVVGGGGGSFQIFVLLCTACLLLDASMTALLEKSNILFPIGIVAILVRLASLALGIWGLQRSARVALKETLYLHIADDAFVRDWNAFDEAVQGIIAEEQEAEEKEASASSSATAIPKTQAGHTVTCFGWCDDNAPLVRRETAARKVILRAIVVQMERLYETYRTTYSTSCTNNNQRQDGGGKDCALQLGADVFGPQHNALERSNNNRGASITNSFRKRCGNNNNGFQKGEELNTIKVEGSVALLQGSSSGNANTFCGDSTSHMPAAAKIHNNALRRRKSLLSTTDQGTLDWLRLNEFRRAMHSHDDFFIKLVLFLLLVLTLLTIGNVAFEFWKIFANQSPLFPEEANFLDRDFVKRTVFPFREATGLKVHIVVMDGLREDFTEPDVSVLGDYLNEPSFKADSLKFSARAQLPSFSVPNWMTILSGSPPEDTGVTGNLQNGETYYDTIYGITKEYRVHSGMTGTPWWASLVSSALPPLGGDGTISTDKRPEGVGPYPWNSGDLADDMRGRVAVQAARRSTVPNPFAAADPSVTNLYELFLTHFSDIDMQGHDYGIDVKYNSRDSYRGAVANKTRLLKDIVSAIDSNTVLIVTSDHGHVMRGGHGGDDSVLRDIPVVFYKKGSGVSMPASTNFLPTEEPRRSFDNKYSNLDLSATVTALLGLPSPRQSLGIFIEEALDAFLPSNSTMRLRFFHDLLLAKINLVKEYENLLETTFFKSTIPSVLHTNPIIRKLAAMTDDKGAPIEENIFSFDDYAPFVDESTNQPLTERDYADLIRLTLSDYKKLRDHRFDIVFYRNLALSVCVVLPALAVLFSAYRQSAFVRFTAMRDPNHPNFKTNLVQFIGALVTVMLYALLAIVTYIVIYFAVVGQKQWDPTAVHTPSVAVRFLCAVLVAPVVYFTLITKVWLWSCNCIHWRLPEAFAELKALKQREAYCFFIFRWLSYHIPRDMATVLLVSRQFKPSEFLKAHLYMQFLALIVALMSIILLFLCFPFSFFLPVVFNISHVSDFNIVYRFRVITVMFMMVPLQVGVMLMLYFTPHRGQRVTEGLVGGEGGGKGVGAAAMVNARLWDSAFLVGRLQGDAHETEKALLNAMAMGANGGANTAEAATAMMMLKGRDRRCSRLMVGDHQEELEEQTRIAAAAAMPAASSAPEKDSPLAAKGESPSLLLRQLTVINSLIDLIRDPASRMNPLYTATSSSMRPDSSSNHPSPSSATAAYGAVARAHIAITHHESHNGNSNSNNNGQQRLAVNTSPPRASRRSGGAKNPDSPPEKMVDPPPAFVAQNE